MKLSPLISGLAIAGLASTPALAQSNANGAPAPQVPQATQTTPATQATEEARGGLTTGAAVGLGVGGTVLLATALGGGSGNRGFFFLPPTGTTGTTGTGTGSTGTTR